MSTSCCSPPDRVAKFRSASCATPICSSASMACFSISGVGERKGDSCLVSPISVVSSTE